MKLILLNSVKMRFTRKTLVNLLSITRIAMKEIIEYTAHFVDQCKANLAKKLAHMRTDENIY